MAELSKSQSLANRYRPQTFDEMIWQQHIIWILKAKMQSDSSALQNYLLYGPRWTWKTTSARILAKAINCLDPHDWNPCNKCANCELINSGKTTDYVEIDAASNTGVDNVREVIIDQAGYQPISLKKKIYVIDEVHMLSGAAFNALLKTIEEPGANVCFILATTELQKVPQTIISRVQVFNFKKIPQDEMVAHLENICKAEWFEYENEALELIATISEWCVRDAIKYLDQVSVLWKISTENVSHFLWISTDATIRAFFDSVKTGDRDEIFNQIDKLAQWTDLQQFAKQCVGYIDSHIMDDTDFYLKVSEAFSEILRQIRFYPYPAVLYKLAFNNYLLWGDIESKPTKKSEPKKEVKAEKEDKVSLTKGGAEWNEAEGLKDTKEIPPTPLDKGGNPDWDLWERVINQTSSDSAKKTLKDHIVIDKVEWNKVFLILENDFVVNAAFNKARPEIESIFKKEIGENITLDVQTLTKDEFLKRLMWA